MNIHNTSCGMQCKRIKPIEYKLVSLPLTDPTKPNVRNVLQTYKTNRIPS